jgi:predicted chitinase
MTTVSRAQSSTSSKTEADGTGAVNVTSGDTLTAIAAKTGVSLKALIAANPQIKNPNLIFPGDAVNIPAGGSAAGMSRAQGGERSAVRNGEVAAPSTVAQAGDVSPAQLQQIVKNLPAAKAAEVAPHINAAMREAGITTPRQKAAFVAQLAHESGGFRYNEEIASGSAYEGRRDLGNTQPGDGVRFKGRGFIQVTGRANYEAAGKALGLPLTTQPELAAKPENAARIAAWFWKSRGLNGPAEAGKFDDVTRRINGGLNGKASRDQLYQSALHVFANAPAVSQPSMPLAPQASYQVQMGETLSEVARKYNTTVEELRRLNPDLRNNRIYPGKRLVLSPAQTE